MVRLLQIDGVCGRHQPLAWQLQDVRRIVPEGVHAGKDELESGREGIAVGQHVVRAWAPHAPAVQR